MKASSPEGLLDEEERQRIEQELREQLEQEHQDRVSKASTRGKPRASRSEEYERAVVAKELRERFYEEKGYVRYKNSRGEVEWLLPEEAERRKQARKRRKRRKRPKGHSGEREPLSPVAWGVLILGFLTLGLFLGYFVLRG